MREILALRVWDRPFKNGARFSSGKGHIPAEDGGEEGIRNVSANCFMGYFVGGLCQLGTTIPTTQIVSLYGDGNVKAIFVKEDDIALYTIKMIDDQRTLNKTVYIRPPENILSQREVVIAWEELKKSSISEVDFLSKIKDQEEEGGIGNF